MAQRKFNSVEGFSVGIPGNVIAVVDNVANVYANRVFVQQYANLGDVGNVYIGGGLNNQVLKTDGSGSLYWALDTAPAGGNTSEVQFNSSGSLDGSAAFTFDNITNALSITGNITSDNASLGNVATANYFNGTLTTQSQPNITSVGTLTSLSVTSNVTSAYFVGNGIALSNLTGGNVDGQVGNALVAGTVYSNAQPNITSVGTLVDLSVTGNITADYFIGNGSTLTHLNAANVDGQLSNALVAGTVYGNVQSNITSLGTLASLTVTGDTILGNVTINGTTGNLSVTNLTVQDNIIDISAETLGTPSNNAGLRVIRGDEPSVQLRWTESTTNWQFTNDGSNYFAIVGKDSAGNVSVGNVAATLFTGTLTTNAQPNITSVGTLSTLSVSGNVTSAYFIGNGAALTYINASNVTGQVSNALIASTVYTNAQPNITSVGTLVSLEVTGNVTADYYFGDGGLLSNISGANVSQVANANYATFAGTVVTAVQPNITSVGTLVDANINGNVLIGGNLVVNGTTFYTNVDQLLVEDPIIEQGGGPNGNPLTTNDGKDRGALLHYYTTKPVDAFMGWDNSNAEFAFGSNVTLASEIATFNSYGNVRANYFLGNASQLVGTIANANYAAYAGTVTTNAQPNITSVGTLTSLSVTANVTSGNASLGNLVTANYFSGDGSFITNLTAGTQIRNGTSNVGIPSTNGNVSVGVNGTNNVVVVASNSLTLTGNLYVSSNILRDSKNVPTYVSATAAPSNPVTGDQWYDQVNDVTYQYIYDGTSYFWVDISSGYVASNVNAIANTLVLRNQFGNVYANGLYANVLNIAGISNLGPVGNVRITGGTSGQYLQTDGTGNLSWSSVAAGSTSNISNGTSNINAGTVNGNITVSVAGTSNTVVFTSTGMNVSGYVNTGTGNITTGNAALGNLATANYFSGNGSLLTYLNASNIGAGTIPSSILGNSTVYIGTTSIALNRSSGSQSLTGVNIDGSAGTATTAGTVTTNSQPNITSVGTLTSLVVSTTANVGTLNATDGSFSGNVIVSGNLTVQGNTNYINVDSFTVEDPIIEQGGGPNNAPLTTNDGKDRGSLLHYYTTKPVDAFMGWDNSNAEFAFGSNVSVSSELVTFNSYGNVRASYFLGNASLLSGVNASNLVSGTISSSILGNSAVYIGTTSIALNRTSGSQSLTGVSIDGTAGTVTTNAQPNITSVGTLTSVSVTANVSAGNVLTNNLLYANGVAWSFGSTYSNANVAAYLPTYTGNVSADYFIGNGATLTFVTGANVDGQVSNALVSGTVYTNAQPNITSVGTLTSLDVSGDANVDGVLYANTIVGPSSANVTITAGTFVSEFDDTGNITLADNVNVINNLSAANVLTDHLLYANGVAWDLGGTYANSNVANYLPTYTGEFTAGNVNTTGNVTAAYFIGNGSQLTGLPASYSNANVSAYLPTYTGNISANYFIGNGATLTFITGANVDGQVGNALVAGTVYTNAQPNITSLGTLTSVSVTGNVSAGNIKSDHLLYANGDPYVFTTAAAGSNTQIQFNDNTAFAGNANLTFNKTTNTVTTDNIDLNGNINVSGLTDLGSIANITITGGTSGYVLTTDGSGGLTWGAAGSGAAGLVSISKDRFLTTGSANTFSLSTTPASQNLIEVIIDGLQQISNTYSLAGSVLSFPTNPAAGQIIEVTTFGAVDLTGNIGEVQYNAGGAFGSSNTFTFNSGSNTLSVTHLTATGNLTSQAGYVYVNNGIIAVDSGNAGIFNTSVANINLGLAANVTVGSTTGNTTIRGNLLANNASVSTLSVGDYYSSRDSVTVTTDTIIDQFPVNTYRSAKYTMRVNSDDGYQAVEVLLVHNGSSSYVTIYGSISSSGSDIITMSSNIGSGNVRLFASTASTNTNVKILGTYVPD